MIDAVSADRLFGYGNAFSHPATGWMVGIVVGLLAMAWILVRLLRSMGKLGDKQSRELDMRIKSWSVLIPALVIPLLLGAAWVILGLLLLCLLCFREFARATGLFREPTTSLAVVLGILALGFATLDHWYGFFMALQSLCVMVIAAASIFPDKPGGYIQRVALGVFGFLLFGVGLGHIGYIANDPDYRPYILLLFLCVEMNDVFAYLSGKLFGKRKLAPNTSPNKTLAGSLGAILGTTALAVTAGQFVFAGTEMDTIPKLVGLGILLSMSGQLGDLLLSSIKRDIGIKDMGAAIPGHGGLLDRFDSLIIASPAFFHYVGYFIGFGLEMPTRIFTGG